MNNMNLNCVGPRIYRIFFKEYHKCIFFLMIFRLTFSFFSLLNCENTVNSIYNIKCVLIDH